jgi:hypothetical protein
MRIWSIVFLSAAILSALQFPQTCPNGAAPRFPDSAETGIDSCPLDGSAPLGSGDALQNEKKNNFCAAGEAASIDIAQLAALQKQVEAVAGKNKYKAGSPPPNRAFLAPMGEGKVVEFVGYVFEARQECAETVNCGASSPNVDASHDIHIAMIAQPRKNKPSAETPASQAEECGGFVAEMNPHHRPPEWTQCNVNEIAAQGLRVRVTGQQMFDGSHVPCKGNIPVGSNPRRVSLWEIHPIYSFEVCPSGDCAGGGWVPLETFDANTTTCVNPACKN